MSFTVQLTGDDSFLTQNTKGQSQDSTSSGFRRRRNSVFAEAYNPDQDESSTVIYPKTNEQREVIFESVKHIFLFRSLDKELFHRVLDEMYEKQVSPNEHIFQQGDNGDNFYVIQFGVFKSFTNNDLLQTYENSGCFGELALLYNVIRSSTVTAVSKGLLWVLNRDIFRRILLKSAFEKRKIYEKLLNNVPMLNGLQIYEKMNLADALVSRTYKSKEQIIKQNDIADGMYFIEEGQVSVRLEQQGADDIEMETLKKGDHFGEFALIKHRNTSLSIYAICDVTIAFLNVEAFERLLGPCMEIMKRRADDYEKRLIKLLENKENAK